VTLRRRLVAALRASVADPGVWPIGMLGFLVRGGLVVLALPILTLPSPIGLATWLGPAVISTGRLEGPLLTLLLVSALAASVILAVALILAAVAQVLVHARRRPPGPRSAPAVARDLVAVELLAIAPLAAMVAVTIASVSDAVRSELLQPGDLAVPLPIRVVSRTLLPLAAVVSAILVAEAIDGTLARAVLVPRRGLRPTRAALTTVVVTAALGWLVTSAVLIPGLFGIGATWAAARVAWSTVPTTQPASADLILALLATAAMVAVWIVVLILCGLASLVRAHLWTSRVTVAGDWTSVGH
jgi:hypothetical protein